MGLLRRPDLHNREVRYSQAVWTELSQCQPTWVAHNQGQLARSSRPQLKNLELVGNLRSKVAEGLTSCNFVRHRVGQYV
jgi:hypothetical protein